MKVVTSKRKPKYTHKIRQISLQVLKKHIGLSHTYRIINKNDPLATNVVFNRGKLFENTEGS